MSPPRALAVVVLLGAAVLLLARAALADEHVGDHGDHDMGGGEMTAAPEGMVSMPSAHLQAMIDQARPGMTIEVPRAVYVGQVSIDKPLTLEGLGRPILDGDLRGSVLTITARDVSVRGFLIRGSGGGPIGSPSGVMVEGADRVHIEDVAIERCYIGITVRASDDVVIDGVRILGQGSIADELHAVAPGHGDGEGSAGARSEAGIRGDGIWLWNTSGALVRGSTLEAVRDGVFLSYGTGAVLESNTIADSRYAIHDMYAKDLTIRQNTLRGNLSGAVLMYGGPVVVQGNTVVESGSPSTGFGVLVKDAGSVTVERNVIADNRVGLHLDDAGRTGGEPTLVLENTIAMNQVGVMLYPSADTIVSGNGFIENSTQVLLGGEGGTQVRWDLGGVGNYWSDYGGFDAAGDGTGDMAYAESGRVSRLLAREPMLMALASGPAFRLLSAVEDRWAPADPVVRDVAPLTTSRGPAIRVAHESPPVPLWIPGAALAAGSAALLLRARRPRARSVARA